MGKKDAQQVAVLQRLVRDLNFNLELVVCPIVREPDGLAMSSRNKYLDAEQRQSAQRQSALVLSRSIKVAEQMLADGERSVMMIVDAMRQVIVSKPHTKIDYISIADPLTLNELSEVEDSALISLAVYVGTTRLIDNSLWRSEQLSVNSEQ